MHEHVFYIYVRACDVIEISEFSQINDVLCEIDLAATKAINEGKALPVWWGENKPPKITKKQFDALHVWCGLCADFLNESGIEYGTRVKFNGKTVTILWEKEKFKDDVFKPMLFAMTGKTSTKGMTNDELSAVASAIRDHLGRDHGLNLPDWPSIR